MSDRLADTLREWWAGKNTPEFEVGCPNSGVTVAATARTTPRSWVAAGENSVLARYNCQSCSQRHVVAWKRDGGNISASVTDPREHDATLPEVIG